MFNVEGHPESIDPPWMQELVRRAFDRELRRLQIEGDDPEWSEELAMWFVFDIRNDLVKLYQAGGAGT